MGKKKANPRAKSQSTRSPTDTQPRSGPAGGTRSKTSAKRKHGDGPTGQSTTAAAQKKLRSQLAKLDRQILESLNCRAALACEISQPAGRENQELATGEENRGIEAVIERNPGPLSTAAVRGVFRELVSGCQQLQRQVCAAYLGPEHSYSHLAAIERFGQSVDLVPLGTIAAVFEEVTAGNVEYGVVPLENSTDGRIADTLSMLTKVQVRITGEVHLRIHHCLLGRGSRSKIVRICSKPQALSQCREWLARHHPRAELVESASTAAAAEWAAGDAKVAAIASRQAGVFCGLDVLAANIEDHPDNITRFAVLGQSSGPRTGNDKTALLFQVRHEPGALADVMGIFKRNRLNLTWIESFPLPGRHNEYFFLAELQGHEDDLRVRRAISSLRKKTQDLEVLGSFAATQPVA